MSNGTRDPLPPPGFEPRDLWHAARGFLMGGADIIPGVSGGTVALILGIYERLVTALSHFDIKLLRLLRNRQWAEAAHHLDLRFLIPLGTGIAVGVGGLASLMHYLLLNHLQFTYAAFFGLIAASTWLVGRMVERWTWTTGLWLAAALAVAFWLVGQPALTHPPQGDGYIFLCGVLGICAMILPGISGAFILLILGKYIEITGLLKQLLHGEATTATVFTIGVFVTGCVVGLLSFSKALRWLLARHEAPTMAALCGFMAGSLRKIWPFKNDLTPEISDLKLKRLVNVWPEQFDGDVLVSLLIAGLAAALVLLLDRVTKVHEQVPPLHEVEPAVEES